MASHKEPTKRGVPRWLKVTTITLLVFANLAVLGVLWIVNVGQNALAEADTDSEVADVLDVSSSGDLTFLVIGSDTREGLDNLDNFGASGGERGDVILLVKANRDGSAQMLSIPRDLWVNIPGHGENKINAAYAFGGSSLMVQTIQQNLGLEINHYVEIDFVGFMDMIDEIGGVEIFFPYPARDSKSGLNVEAGNQRLDGAQALAYARSRQYQEYQDGSWVGVAANDIGRTQRQQDVVRAILSALKTPSSITDAGDIANSLAKYMTIDTLLAGSSVAQLGWDFKGVLGGNIEGATLPVTIGTAGGASVVFRDDPAAETVIANFVAGRPFAEQPMRIQVLNGNGVPGAASDMARELEALGYVVVSVGDSEDKYATTQVLVSSDSLLGAEIVAALGFGEVIAADVDNSLDAVVIVGGDGT